MKNNMGVNFPSGGFFSVYNTAFLFILFFFVIFNLVSSKLFFKEKWAWFSCRFFGCLLAGFVTHILLVRLYTLFLNRPPIVEVLMLIGMLGWVLVFYYGSWLLRAEKTDENIARFLYSIFFVLGLDLIILFVLLLPYYAHTYFFMPVLPMGCPWQHIVPCYSGVCFIIICGGLYKIFVISRLKTDDAKQIALLRLRRNVWYIILVLILFVVMFLMVATFL